MCDSSSRTDYFMMYTTCVVDKHIRQCVWYTLCIEKLQSTVCLFAFMSKLHTLCVCICKRGLVSPCNIVHVLHNEGERCHKELQQAGPPGVLLDLECQVLHGLERRRLPEALNWRALTFTHSPMTHSMYFDYFCNWCSAIVLRGPPLVSMWS